MAETYSWRIGNIPAKTKRIDLCGTLKNSIDTPFLLFFKNGRKYAILITTESELPAIKINEKALSIKEKKIEHKEIENVVTPLCTYSYEEQLEIKKNTFQKTCLFATDPEVFSSPIREGYRNKCEFTFGMDANNIPTLGFRAIEYISAPNTVASPEKCIYNVSKEMLSITAGVTAYIKDKASLVYNRITQEGFLKLLLVRKIKNKTLGVLLVNGEDSCENISPELLPLIEAIQTDTLYIAASRNHCHEGFNINMPLHLAKGSNVHEEELANCMFSLSPLSFFQINIPVAEKMATIIRDLVKEQVVVDVCCGSGVLGICAVKGTDRKVIGLEIDKNAVVNAQANAARNSVNAEYHCGEAEKNLLSLIPPEEKCTVLLDPPRSGVPSRLLEKIASYRSITQIIYVSCEYTLIQDNLKTIAESGYTLKKTFILDMFPYTKQIECIFIYEKS